MVHDQLVVSVRVVFFLASKSHPPHPLSMKEGPASKRVTQTEGRTDRQREFFAFFPSFIVARKSQVAAGFLPFVVLPSEPSFLSFIPLFTLHFSHCPMNKALPSRSLKKVRLKDDSRDMKFLFHCADSYTSLVIVPLTAHAHS